MRLSKTNVYKGMLFTLLMPFSAMAHPGIGIVKNSKGIIYYTDLQQVWKIMHGKKTIAVPNVHSHELYIDENDNLYGENERYSGEADNKFFHYLWALRPDGRLDTLVSNREAYINIDFSLARDKEGSEYYIKQFIKRPDTAHIYKRTPNGKEHIIASGNFKGVSWLHPQEDGSLLFYLRNTVYKLSAAGQLKELATNVTQSAKTVWGIWTSSEKEVLIAVYGEGVVRKIHANGVRSDVYKSPAGWAPIHGVFGNDGKLWVMEASDKNVIRVVDADVSTHGIRKDRFAIGNGFLFISSAALGVIIILLIIRAYKRRVAI